MISFGICVKNGLELGKLLCDVSSMGDSQKAVFFVFDAGKIIPRECLKSAYFVDAIEFDFLSTLALNPDTARTSF